MSVGEDRVIDWCTNESLLSTRQQQQVYQRPLTTNRNVIACLNSKKGFIGMLIYGNFDNN